MKSMASPCSPEGSLEIHPEEEEEEEEDDDDYYLSGYEAEASARNEMVVVQGLPAPALGGAARRMCARSKGKGVAAEGEESGQRNPTIAENEANPQPQGFEDVFDTLTKALKDPADFVDFDLPSSLKEWKLGYYIPIKRNIYITKHKRRVKDDGIFCSCNISSGSSVACEKDCQCGMLFSCCSSNCMCESKCANKAFQHRPLKKTKLITTEKCGFGLVAEDEIKKGEFVIEYVGEVIDDRTCEERLWKMKRQRYTHFYLCEVSSNLVIDATNKGNMSRFINHSCEPNTEMQKWTVDGETRVGIFALRNIKKGEELTYDYKFVQFGADQDCHCGSSNCKKMVGTPKSVNSIVLQNGNLGSSQDQHDVKKRKTTSDNCIGEIIRLWDRRDKMYVPAVVYDYDEHTGMHTLLLEDLTTEKFNMREEDWAFLPHPDDPSDED